MKDLLNAIHDALIFIKCFVVLIGQSEFWRRTLSAGLILSLIAIYRDQLNTIPAWASFSWYLSVGELFRLAFITLLFVGCVSYWLYTEYRNSY